MLLLLSQDIGMLSFNTICTIMNNIIVNLIVHADLEFQLDLAFVSFVGIIGEMMLLLKS